MKLRHKSTQVNLVDVDFIKSTKKIENQQDIVALFNIEKKRLTAKTDLTIVIDQSNYRDEMLTDLGDKFILPGILDVTSLSPLSCI